MDASSELSQASVLEKYSPTELRQVVAAEGRFSKPSAESIRLAAARRILETEGANGILAVLGERDAVDPEAARREMEAPSDYDFSSPEAFVDAGVKKEESLFRYSIKLAKEAFALPPGEERDAKLAIAREMRMATTSRLNGFKGYKSELAEGDTTGIRTHLEGIVDSNLGAMMISLDDALNGSRHPEPATRAESAKYEARWALGFAKDAAGAMNLTKQLQPSGTATSNIPDQPVTSI